MRTLQRIYEWTMALAGNRYAVIWLAFVSFIESFIFPIPPDVVLIPMVLAKRSRVWVYATICTLSSVIGGLAGYAVGYFLFETIGQGIITFYRLQNDFIVIRSAFDQYGAAIILVGAFTPIPYKLITISTGITQTDLTMFVTASFIGRGSRFFLVTGLLWRFGQPIRTFIEDQLSLVVLGVGILLVGSLLLMEIL